MPNETVVLDYESVIRINGTPFGVTGGKLSLVHDEHEVGDSETGRNKAFKRGRFEADCSCNFYGKSDVDYHAAPLKIGTATDETFQLWIYAKGLGDDPYKLDPFTAFNYVMNFGKESGELKGSFDGKTGNCLRPGE